MRCAINSDGKGMVLREDVDELRNGLYVKRFESCLVRERQLSLPKQGEKVLQRKEEIERIVCEIYDNYASFFSLKSERNIAICATEYYTDALHRYMEVVLGEFDAYCKATGQEELYNMLAKIVSASELFLLDGLREEIRKNALRYTLQPVSYYVQSANLRKAHLKESGRKETRERLLLHQSNEFIVSAVCEALLTDCKEKLEFFSRRAQLRYEAYVDVLQMWFASYQVCLPNDTEGEEWEDFCHALRRRGYMVKGEGDEQDFQKKYVSYTPCDCGLATCKTWRTGDEAEYEIAKWYGMWYGEQGECLEFTEKCINGQNYIVKRCYMDTLPQGKRLHMEFCNEEVPGEVWIMHFGKNLLEFTGEGAELYYIVLENMERQFMRAYCEKEIGFDVAE